MAKGDLVPVGHVFAVFAAHDDHDLILGIEVTGHAFGTKNELVIKHPADESHFITARVHTLEHERTRTNVALPGKQYGVKPFRHGSETLIVNPTGWQVYVPANQSEGAATRKVRTWPRPTRFQEKRTSLSQTRW